MGDRTNSGEGQGVRERSRRRRPWTEQNLHNAKIFNSSKHYRKAYALHKDAQDERRLQKKRSSYSDPPTKTCSTGTPGIA